MLNLNSSGAVCRAKGVDPKSQLRKTGIEVIGDACWGTHFCQFYENSQDLADILVPYFKAGLENNEFCMWITAPDFTAHDAVAALRRALPDGDRYLETGQIEILPHSDWYLLGGTFDLQRVLTGWVAKLDQALARGFAGLRLSGNTMWLERKDWGDFTEYEAAINEVIGLYPMMALCSYSLAKCGAPEILDVARNHQFALLRSETGWQVLESHHLRQARELQRVTEDRYRALFNALNEGVAVHEIVCDQNGEPVDYRFLEVNPAFGRLTGLAPDVVIGKCVRELIPDIEPFWIQTYGKVALTGQPAHFEYGSAALGKLYEVFAYSPAPRQFAALFIDVTDRKRASEERERLLLQADLNLKELGAVVNSISQSLIVADPDGNIQTMNPAALALHGFESVDALKLRLSGEPDLFQMSTLDGRPIPEHERPMARALRGERVVNMVVRVLRRDTGRNWIGSYSAMPVADNAGTTLLAVVTIHDLTELKRSEEALRRANEQLEYRVTTRTAELRAANEALLEEISERKKSQDELSRYRNHLEELVQQRTTELQVANARLQQEITERRRTEQILRQTADELSRSNRDLDQFASATSHDLQEPLRAVAGYVGLLQQRYAGRLDDKALSYITAAADGAARMQNLITDLLAFSRVGTRGRGFAPADLNLALDAALSNLAVSIRESGARITCATLPTLHVDGTQIAQLFQNLIGNAIKFRSDRPPEIDVQAEERPEHWVFSVRDNGIGIDPQYSERIFLLFQRLHTRQKYPGTGIGLAVCKRIIERHEGRIWVESKPGEGSTFYFSLPHAISLPVEG